MGTLKTSLFIIIYYYYPHHRCHSAVLVFAVTALCTSVPNRCRIPPVYAISGFFMASLTLRQVSCNIVGKNTIRRRFLAKN